jgi:RNA polymerase sigma-70 factor (ECF subfamily)
MVEKFRFFQTSKSGLPQTGSLTMVNVGNANFCKWGNQINADAKNPLPEQRDEFVRLLVRHDRAIRAWLRASLPTMNDVDEVMQEVSVVAWRKFDQLDDPENFQRWVCVIARYEVLMYRRKKARDRFVLGSEVEQLIADEGQAELELREKQLGALEHCVQKLPESKRELVIDIYSSGMPMNAVAKQLGTSDAALYKSISRVRKSLLDCIERSLAEGATS